jgi:uncharacterized protein (TIGR02996 family)
MPRRARSTTESQVDPILSQVLRDPEDDALRQVWADALQERGDPRGELIALQIAAGGGRLSPAQDKRARSLFAKHTLAWLGPLGDLVMRKAALVFDRGLVSSCQIQIKNLKALAESVGHPLWATVRQIWFCDHHCWHARIVPLLTDPAFLLLREVTCIGANNVFAALASQERPLPFTSIWALDDDWRSETPRALRDGPGAEARALPHLRRFGLTSSGVDPTWVFDLPLVRRIETLGLSLPLSTADCLARTERLENLRRLEVRPSWIMIQGAYRSHLLLDFVRDARGKFSELTIGIGHYRGPFAPRLAGVLPPAVAQGKAEDPAPYLRGLTSAVETIPADLLRKITVRFPDSTKTNKPFARFRSADVVFAPAPPG